MYNPKLEKLNSIISGYIVAAVSTFHDQEKGIRVTDFHTESEELNPPGVKYNLRIGVQVTFGPDGDISTSFEEDVEGITDEDREEVKKEAVI